VQVLQKAWNLLSDDVGSKRPFSMSECALWARSAGPQFSAQVAAPVGLVEAPANHWQATAVANEAMTIMLGNKTCLSIEKFLESPFAGKHPKHINKGAEVAAAKAAVTAAEAIAVADFEETKLLAAEFEAMGGGALTMALAQEAKPDDPLRDCGLARERPRVSEARSINLPGILTAHADAAAKAAEVAAAEAAFAEDATATEAAAAVNAAAAAGAAAKAAADAPGARAALAAELPKEPDGGTAGMAEDAEEIPGRPMFSVGAREELKTRSGSLSSEGANAAVRAENQRRSKF
jgi:hypothetical protein